MSVFDPLRTSKMESLAYVGQSRVQRHRAITTALDDLMEERVHALSIKAIAPGE